MALAGNRLVDGKYEPIAIEIVGGGRPSRYRQTLALYICREVKGFDH